MLRALQEAWKVQAMQEKKNHNDRRGEGKLGGGGEAGEVK